MGSDPESKPRSRNGKADERVSIPLPFEDAMKGLLKVDPKSLPAEPNGKRSKRPAKPKK